jgi:hypothetical protein
MKHKVEPYPTPPPPPSRFRFIEELGRLEREGDALGIVADLKEHYPTFYDSLTGYQRVYADALWDAATRVVASEEAVKKRGHGKPSTLRQASRRWEDAGCL